MLTEAPLEVGGVGSALGAGDGAVTASGMTTGMRIGLGVVGAAGAAGAPNPSGPSSPRSLRTSVSEAPGVLAAPRAGVDDPDARLGNAEDCLAFDDLLASVDEAESEPGLPPPSPRPVDDPWVPNESPRSSSPDVADASSPSVADPLLPTMLAGSRNRQAPRGEPPPDGTVTEPSCRRSPSSFAGGAASGSPRRAASSIDAPPSEGSGDGATDSPIVVACVVLETASPTGSPVDPLGSSDAFGANSDPGKSVDACSRSTTDSSRSPDSVFSVAEPSSLGRVGDGARRLLQPPPDLNRIRRPPAIAVATGRAEATSTARSSTPEPRRNARLETSTSNVPMRSRNASFAA